MTRKYLVLLGFACLVFWPSFVFPYLDIDELIFGEVANSMVNGCPPYVCVLGAKPPLLYLFYAGIFSVFGKNSYLATHIVHVLWIAATALVLQEGTKVRWVGFCYILLVALPNFRNLAVTGESLMNLFMVLSWILFLRSVSRPGLVDALGMGALVGIASLLRHQAGIQLVVYGALFLWTARGHGAGAGRLQVVGRVAGLVLGFSLVWASLSLVMYLWGAWDDFFSWSVLYNLGYIGRGGTAPGAGHFTVDNLAQVLGFTSVFWVFAIFGLRDRSSPAGLVRSGVLYLLGACLAASVGFRFFPHYFIQAFPPLAVLAALGVEQLRRTDRGRFWRAAPAVGLSLAFGFLMVRNAFVPYLLRHDGNRDYAPINAVVGRYLQERTDPDDRIFVWGWGYGIYYYADRQIGSRYPSDFLSGRVPGTLASAESALQERENAISSFPEFFAELDRNGVVYFVNTSPAGMHEYQFFPPVNYPELETYLREKFELEATLQEVEIYRRKPG